MNNMYSVQHKLYFKGALIFCVYNVYYIFNIRISSDCVNLVKTIKSAKFEELYDRIDVNIKYNL